jgi:hypothetical protein
MLKYDKNKKNKQGGEDLLSKKKDESHQEEVNFRYEMIPYDDELSLSCTSVVSNISNYQLKDITSYRTRMLVQISLKKYSWNSWKSEKPITIMMGGMWNLEY